MWRLRKKRSLCRFHSTSTISWLLLSQLTTNRCERERTSKNKLARFAIWKTLFLNFLKGPSKLLWRALCSSQVKVIAHSWLLSCKIIAEHHFGADLRFESTKIVSGLEDGCRGWPARGRFAEEGRGAGAAPEVGLVLRAVRSKISKPEPDQVKLDTGPTQRWPTC